MKTIELLPIVGAFALIMGGIQFKISHDLDKLADKLSNAEQHYFISSVRPLGENSEAQARAVMIEPRATGESFLICHKTDDGKFTLSTAARSASNGNYSKIISRPSSDAVIAVFCDDAFSRI